MTTAKKTARKKRAKRASAGDAPPEPTLRQSDRDAVPELDGPVFDEDKNKCLHKYDLALLSLAQERIKTSALDVALVEREIARLQLEYDKKIMCMAGKLERLKAVAQDPAKALLALRRKIEEVYGINLQNITYDDVSGRLFVHTEDGTSPAR